MKERIAVSACLLGLDTKYNGKNNYNEKILSLIKNKIVLPICPEVFGGLSIPREPSEEKENNKFYSISGKDVSVNYIDGAKKTIDFLKRNNVKDIILKNGSPSCGNYTYDGTFTKTKTNRMGITARLLNEEGFNLIYID